MNGKFEEPLNQLNNSDMTDLMVQTVPNTYILISEMTEKESDGEKGTALF